MPPEMGEYIIGAYLKLIKECDFVIYNVRFHGGGLKGLNEIDVVGINLKTQTAYLCEATTHIRGLLYKNNSTTIEKIKEKYNKLKNFANEYLSDFTPIFMFWSPVVPKGFLTRELAKIEGLQVVINENYTQCVNELREKAKRMTNDIGNPFFRALQILEHLK